jgi:hypothetical protein
MYIYNHICKNLPFQEEDEDEDLILMNDFNEDENVKVAKKSRKIKQEV